METAATDITNCYFFLAAFLAVFLAAGLAAAGLDFFFAAGLASVVGAAAAGAVTGTGLGVAAGGFVVCCAKTPVVNITPSTNQQFVFITRKVEFLFPVVSMSATAPVSIRPT